MAYMYIARCRDGSYYTGSTDKDPEIRIWEHNNHEDLAARFTIKRRPIVLVYVETFERKDLAFAREKQVQGWSRAKKEALIEGRGSDLPGLSRGGDASTSSLPGLSRGGDASTSSASGRYGREDDASTSSANGRDVRGGDASTSSASGRVRVDDASTSSASGPG
jgi:putative endonuclease